MKYIFNEDSQIDIVDRVLKQNGVTKQDLDVTNFEVDYNIQVINDFKEALLSNKDKSFLIVGDYDCDGICSTTIIKKLLTDLDIKCNHYIPSRIKQGYGLNQEIVLNAYNNKFDCIFCVDNGVVAYDAIDKANELGIEVYIIDHHEYEQLPKCSGFLHPRIFPKEYEDMCASGVCALLSNSFRYDDLTTVYGGLATLADMVKVFGYNRYLIKQMLDTLKHINVEPISLLLGKNDITYQNLQFSVIPRINAVSRLDNLMNVNYVVKYLLSSGQECLDYFYKIETINKARKDYSQQMQGLALRLIDDSRKIAIVEHKDFKEGLCGLVANKLLDVINKPVIVFAEVDGILKGSGRSIEGFNIYEYLKGAQELFESFGGHELAVGISIKQENFDKLLNYIDTHDIDIQERNKDVLLVDSDELNFDLLNELKKLEPFGTGFVEPLFAMKNLNYKNFIVANKYPKFIINDFLSAISFNNKHVNRSFSYMVGHLKKDDYKNNCLSFVIEDLV